MNQFTVKCIFIGLCGTLLSLLAVNYSLSKKAKDANLEYHFLDFFKTDWYAPVISVVAILSMVIAMPYIPASWQNSTGVILIVFITVGYSGNDLVSRFFSAMNDRLNAAVKMKSNQSDLLNGIPEGTRTPAAPIRKENIPPPSQN
jgi:uncharacterized membrane protein